MIFFYIAIDLLAKGDGDVVLYVTHVTKFISY
jgi:hypothetical protein